VSPALVGVVPSIEMVVWVAVGGRNILWGAIAGTLLVNFAKDQISSALPSLWLYGLGALFILAVSFLPNGIAGPVPPRQRRGARGAAHQGCADRAGDRGMNAAPAQDPNEKLLMMENVTVDFDGFKALTASTSTLDPGTLRILIGPNGAGKSTLCDTIIGRVRPTSGHVTFKDEEITRLAEQEIVRRGICRKFQTPACCRPVRRRQSAGHRPHSARPQHGGRASPPSRQKPAERERVDEILEKSASRPPRHHRRGPGAWRKTMAGNRHGGRDRRRSPAAGRAHRRHGAAGDQRTAQLILSLLGRHAVLVIDHDMSFVEAARTATYHRAAPGPVPQGGHGRGDPRRSRSGRRLSWAERTMTTLLQA
jgi:urea transport system ATP-binding protein